MNIKNKEVYLSRMAAGMRDKLFFVDFLPEDVGFFLDYGCANGTLLREVHKFYPNAICVGYDTNKDFIDEAKSNCPDKCFFYSSLEEVNDKLDNASYTRHGPVVLILSSVIHEIYTYESILNIRAFWNFLENPVFDYLCIRDMGLAKNDWYRFITKDDIDKIHKWASTPERQFQISDFEAKRGKISNQYNLCEFLLKYSYVENWSREVKENYLALSPEFLVENLSYKKWALVHFHHWVLPYVQRKVYDDFGIVMPSNTHYKGVWRRV